MENTIHPIVVDTLCSSQIVLNQSTRVCWVCLTCLLCFLGQSVQQGIYFRLASEEENLQPAAPGGNCVSDIWYQDTGFVNTTKSALKYMSTSSGRAIGYAIMEVSNLGMYNYNDIR